MPSMTIQDPEEKSNALKAAAESQAFKDKMGYLTKLLVGSSLGPEVGYR